MFVPPEKNYALAMDLWHGKPSGRLLWTPYFYTQASDRWAAQAGYATGKEFMDRELGCLQYAHFVGPLKRSNPAVEVVRREEDGARIIEYRSRFGTLTQISRGGRIMQHRVRSPEDLRVLIAQMKAEICEPAPEVFEQARAALGGQWPIVVSMGPSAVQRMVQGDLSVEDFWYAMSDYPALMEEAFAAHEANQLRGYDLNLKLPADGYCQDENTSTTLISPAYYRRYSLGHIRDYATKVRAAGRRLVVHMCGHLRDLVPSFRETGMHGIDCVTPPPVGNCEFRHAYAHMASDFFCTGRFGTSMWFGKSREEILAGLASILPHDIYREHAFVLGVTGDGMSDIPLDNIRLLRDCIEEYERGAKA